MGESIGRPATTLVCFVKLHGPIILPHTASEVGGHIPVVSVTDRHMLKACSIAAIIDLACVNGLLTASLARVCIRQNPDQYMHSLP